MSARHTAAQIRATANERRVEIGRQMRTADTATADRLDAELAGIDALAGVDVSTATRSETAWMVNRARALWGAA